METELKVKINIDGDTGKVTVLNSALGETNKQSRLAAAGIHNIRDKIDLVAHGTQSIVGVTFAFGAFKNAIQSAVGEGIRYNAALEQTQIALKGIIANYTDGANATVKLANAHKIASQVMGKLSIEAAKAGVSANDMAQVFQSFSGGALRAGMSLDQITKATGALTTSAKVMGKDVNQVIMGIDGLADGAVLAGSEFGKMLNILGLSNEVLKKAASEGKLYEVIMQKTAIVTAAAADGNNSFNATMATLDTTIAELRGEMTKPMFEAVSEGARSLTKFLEENRETIVKLPGYFTDAAKAAAIFGAVFLANKARLAAFNALTQAAMNSLDIFGRSAATAAAQTSLFARAQTALKTAFAATPWGVIITGLTAVIAYFATAKSAAEELAKSWDGARESLEKLSAAEIKKMIEELEKEREKLGRDLMYMESSGGGVFGFGRKYGLDRDAEVGRMAREKKELEERINTARGILENKENPAAPQITVPPNDNAKKALEDIAKERERWLKQNQDLWLPKEQQVKVMFANYATEAKKLFKGAELDDILKKLGDAELLKMIEMKRAEKQKIVDEYIRANSATQKIDEMRLDNQVLSGEITEQEANKQKQLLQIKTEILNIEKQMSVLNPETDIARISELDLTKKQLEKQQGLVSEQVLASPLQSSVAEAIASGLVDGLKNGSASAKDILGGIMNGVAGSFMNDFSQTLSKQLSSGLAGGGINMAAIGGGLASAGIGIGVSAIASELTAKWQLVESRDVLQEICDNTGAAATSLKVISDLNNRFGTNYTAGLNTGLMGNNLMSAGANSRSGAAAVKSLVTSWTADFFDSSFVRPFLVGIETYTKKSMFGGTKTKTKKIYADLTEAQAEAIAFLKQFGGDNYGNLNAEGLKKFNEALGAIANIFDGADRFVASITGVNLAEYDVNYASKQFEAAQKYYQSYVGEANKQIKMTNNKILEDRKKAVEYQAALDKYAKLKAIAGNSDYDYESGSFNGTEEQQNAHDQMWRMNWDMIRKYGAGWQDQFKRVIANSKNELNDLLSTDLDFDPKNLANLLNDEFLADLIGSLGKAANVEEITAMFNSLKESAENYVNALRELSRSEAERLKNEASFVEWLNAADSALNNASNAVKSLVGDLRNFAKQARDLIAGSKAEDAAYWQRSFVSAQAALSQLYGADGALREDISKEKVSAIWDQYIEAARGLQGASGEYDYALKNALNAALENAASAMDIASDILSVRIVADDTGLATEETIKDLISALTPVLSLDQIGFSGTSDAAKRALALASGAKSQEELNALLEAIATLRFGDNTSDTAYLQNLSTLAEYDSKTARLLELMERAIGSIAVNAEDQRELSYETLKTLKNMDKREMIAEATQ
jgi:hypothetical protein